MRASFGGPFFMEGFVLNWVKIECFFIQIIVVSKVLYAILCYSLDYEVFKISCFGFYNFLFSM